MFWMSEYLIAFFYIKYVVNKVIFKCFSNDPD